MFSKRHHCLFVGALTLLLSLSWATAASAQVIAGQADETEFVYYVDVGTGTTTELFRPADNGVTFNGPEGLAVDDANRIIYVATGNGSSPAVSAIYSAHYDDKEFDLSGHIKLKKVVDIVSPGGAGSLQRIGGLAWDSLNSRLITFDPFHSTTGAGEEGFWEINLTTGVTTSLRLLDTTERNELDFRGIGYNSTNGLFYGYNVDTSPAGNLGLYTIDLNGTPPATIAQVLPSIGVVGSSATRGAAIGNDRAYLVDDDGNPIEVYNLLTDLPEASITPTPTYFTGSDSEGGGAWAPNALVVPAGSNLAAAVTPGTAENVDVESGSLVSYTVDVINLGPDPAASSVTYTIVVSGTGTAGGTISNLNSTSGMAAEGPAGTITATFPSFVFGFTDQITFDVTTSGEGNLIVTADFPPGANTDAYLGNNTDATSHVVRVFPESMAIVSDQSGSDSAAVPGLVAEFTSTIDAPARSPDGTYIALTADTDLGTAEDEVLVLFHNGVGTVIAREDQPPEIEAGVEVDNLDARLSVNNAGHVAFAVDATSSLDDDYIIYWNGTDYTVICQEDDIIPPFAGQGYDYGSVQNSPNITGNDSVWFYCSSLGGGIPSAENAAWFSANSDGSVVDVIMQKGVTVPAGQIGGGTEFLSFLDTDDAWVDGAGVNWLAAGNLTGSTSSDDVLIVNGTVVIQESSTLTGVGLTGTIPAFSTVAGVIYAEMLSNGDWLAHGTTSDADEDWAIRGNGTSYTLLAKKGDEIYPGAGENWSDVDGLSYTFRALAGNNQGDYVILGRTDIADTDRNYAIVLNGTTVVLRENDPVALDADGLFDDDRYVNLPDTDEMLLTDGGELYITTTLRDGAGASGGKALVKVANLPVSPVPTGTDLSVDKVADTALITAVGQQITYTVTVCNGGPDDATGVVLTDTLPPEVTYVSDTGGGVLMGGNMLEVTIGNLAAFGCVQFDIVVEAASEGTAINSATVTGNETDPDNGNNTDTASTTIENQANLAVTKVDDGGAPVGQDFTYTVTITNNGPAPANNVVMTDNLDPTTTFVSATNGATHLAGVVSRTFPSIPNGGMEIVQITVQGTVNFSVVTNTVSVASDEVDVDLGDNSDSVDTLIGDVSDLSVTKTDDGAALVGGNLTYTVTVTNNGPAPATNVVMTDTLDPSTVFVSATNGATHLAGVVTANFASILTGGSEVVQIVVQTTVAGQPVNSATASATEIDPDSLNDTAIIQSLVGEFRSMQVIYSEIDGHPTAQVPGALDAGGLPVATEFKAIEDFSVSYDGTAWMVKGRNELGANFEANLTLGAGSTGDMFAQEGQPFQGGVVPEVYDFFDTGSPASFDSNGNIGFSARARGGVAGTQEKVVVYDTNLMTHTIVLQEGDLLTGLTDEPPNPSGDETLGNSVGSVYLRNDGELWLAVTPIGNCSSFRYPAMLITDTMFRQSRTSMIGGFTWDTFGTSDCGGTPDAAHWYAEGEIEEGATTDDRILAVDDAIVVREGSPIDASALNVADIFHTKMLANGDWFARGDYSDDTDWAVRNGTRLADTGDSVSGGAETWGAVFSSFAGNTNGDWVLVGDTSEADTARDNVLVLNGTDVIVREGDPVDLDGNGKFDDNVFIGRGADTSAAFGANDIWLTDTGVLYFIASLRDAEGNDLGTFGAGGEAFIRINTNCPTIMGDDNADLTVNGLDVNALAACALAGGTPVGQCNCADLDMDNDVDADDVNLAVQQLLLP